MKKYIIKVKRILPAATLFLCAVLLISLNNSSAVNTFFNQQQHKTTIIIDAGHGGFDGGAVSDNGVLEKDLNLLIAKALQNELKSRRYKVVMTRETDCSLAQSKAQDIKNRVKISGDYDNALFISIHCNKFPQKKYSGLQTFYSKANNEELAKLIAESIQSKYISQINPSCYRKAKTADNSIYLMKNAKTTAVLVECGFVSNDMELKKLQDDYYQNSIAEIIADAVEENMKE